MSCANVSMTAHAWGVGSSTPRPPPFRVTHFPPGLPLDMMYDCGMILAALILAASPCEVPPNVTLLPSASDRCQLWAKVEDGWREAQARRWMASYITNSPFKKMEISDAGPITIQEMPFMFFVPGSGSGIGIGVGWYDGMFWPTDPPTIQFNGRWDSPDYPALQHELGHFQGWLAKEPGWAVLGHGTADDPYIRAVNFLAEWIIPFKSGQAYYPGRLPVAQDSPSSLCASK